MGGSTLGMEGRFYISVSSFGYFPSPFPSEIPPTHFSFPFLARAMYVYQAAIPEELSFAKGDVLAVLRLQDDGWWEAEVTGKNHNGRPGLVPSNYLQTL